ncbi:hypothetical protein GCM10023081_37130 [Arthrobacter ginkgonis]|uniref:(S)-ureidoglycine aminohydrolase cupin domain-containing protein n=1 Tax=Arthrobacter ginkgonis TaxID=1630594 RepID=A0ABP7CUY2_9MICC
MQIHKSEVLVFPSAEAGSADWSEFAPAGEPAGWVRGLLGREDLPAGSIQRVSFWKHDGGDLPYAPPMAELVVILQGRVELVDEEGARYDVGPGQVALIPAGFRGTWITREPVLKVSAVVAHN